MCFKAFNMLYFIKNIIHICKSKRYTEKISNMTRETYGGKTGYISFSKAGGSYTS